MKLPRVQFTVRRLMGAVALVAIVISGGAACRRAHDYGIRADAHEAIELRMRRAKLDRPLAKELEEARKDLLKVVDSIDPPGPDARRRARIEGNVNQLEAEWEEDDREDRSWIEWHARMKEKYRRARWRPWETVSAEPSPDGPLSSEMERQLYGP